VADLKTRYMGLALKNPVIAGATTLTCQMETIRRLEEAGAAALVTCSLFEEQVQLERLRMHEELEMFDNIHPEMTDIFPELAHAGPAEHLMWVRKAKESVSIPVIASLNCITPETWVEYAKLAAETGVDGLELNFYSTPSGVNRPGLAIEDEQAQIVREVTAAVALPVAVKLSAFYANPLHVVQRLASAGASGFVLFNRFFEPDIDADEEKNVFVWNLSSPGDYRLALRFVGLLYGQVDDLCASTGIFGGKDIAKLLLAGANVVQVVSTLFRNGIEHLGTMLSDLEGWMDAKGYETLDKVRGKLSHRQSKDPWSYTRAQYVRALIKPDPIEREYRVI
jgi:dihydroorotate dehydrogenase (fumarate)